MADEVLKRKYKAQLDFVRAKFFLLNIYSLSEHESPKDEFDGEAAKIVVAASHSTSVQDFQVRIHKIICESFGDDVMETSEHLESMAKEIYAFCKMS